MTLDLKPYCFYCDSPNNLKLMEHSWRERNEHNEILADWKEEFFICVNCAKEHGFMVRELKKATMEWQK